MKVRIKFQKYGAMKFIGHLDVMRYFQKAFRRANVDNEYTKGFSPHQIMSFAAPLGVGLTSDGEYVDVQLLSSETPEIMLERMNAVLSEGFKIIGWKPLLEQEENKKVVTAMSLVASADYLVSLKDDYRLEGIDGQEQFKAAFQSFLSEKEIVIDKKTKTSEKAVNIRPMIIMVAFDDKEYRDELKKVLKAAESISTGSGNSITTNSNKTVVVEGIAEKDMIEGTACNNQNSESSFGETHYGNSMPESVAEVYNNGIKMFLQLDTGSAANLKPELVMEAFYEYLGKPYEKFAWQVHRLEVYTREEDSNKLIALDQLER